MSGMGISTAQVVMQYVLLALQGFFWRAVGVAALGAAFAVNRFVALKEAAFARKLAAHEAHHGIVSGSAAHGHHMHAKHHKHHGHHGHGGCGCAGHHADVDGEAAEGDSAVDITPFID